MSSCFLPQLPPQPDGRTGWSWTEETNPILYKVDIEYPRISIVTPSYNQGQFIEETIRSVLLQNYPNFEYIIIDGGSTDNTVEIIKKYEPWINYWASEKDRGLKQRFKKATGELVGWQNSDDIYLKNAFSYLLRSYLNHSICDVYYGHKANINVLSRIMYINYFVPFSIFHFKYYGWNISNQSCFFKTSMLKRFLLNESLQYTMDQELFILC